jgi:DDE family transposase/uncharacterized protein DUF4372
VPHDNSVFHAVLQRLDWEAFERAVAREGAAARARGFTCKNHLVALLYGQFAGASSLREIEAGMLSHASRLYHLGVQPVHRSTLADANRNRPVAPFAELLAAMIRGAHRRLRQTMDGATYLIDSTSLALNQHSAGWARFSVDTAGVKTHVIYDADADCPIYAAVSTSNVNDITAAKAMPIEQGATYVFDLGYYDYSWWAGLDAAGCRIVTRLKSNTPLRVTETRPVADGPILSDPIGLLPERLASQRRNPFHKPVREVQVRLDTGRVLRIVSNDLDAPAQQIADLYKRRWAIELFFRWIKQTLKITRFLGSSENAVRIQIAVALIAFVLLRLAHASQTVIPAPLTFARLVRANLMHMRRLDHLQRPPAKASAISGQGVFI